jgi:signal transduction histidine kinase
MMNYNPTDQTILIVDDNPNNLEVLSETLVDAGFQVSIAIDGESALEQVAYHTPELILLDVMMPGIGGFETCRRLQKSVLTRDIPIIFMTALSDSLDKVKGLSLGAVDYITKPFQQEEVLARIRIHLKLHNLSRSLEDQNQLLQYEIEQRKQAEAALKNLNQDLERRVEERTAELSHTLLELKHAQVQLIHNDRMSTLGQLIAGIAHEINNPVNFIYGNIKPAIQYLENLLGLVELYQKNLSNPPEEIHRYLDDIDLEFIKVDLPKLIKSMEVGSDRICQIVSSLRSFSRLDETEMSLADIHEGIDNTLMILQSRLKAKPDRPAIEVIKNYGELPLVECYPGQLNQVFMNILCNAIDAFDDCNCQRSRPDYEKTPNRIIITTESINNNEISIRIADNGLGIPESIQSRLFEPFFTTKAIGKGTGLGLSISRQIIVEKHAGTLDCLSLPGQGTEFRVEIPIAVSSQKLVRLKC